MANTIYTAEAHVTGGRANGHGRTSDGMLEVDLRLPKEMGGQGDGTNPEELFAVGYAACFEGALGVAGRRSKVETGDVAIDSKVSLSPNSERRLRPRRGARRVAAQRGGRRHGEGDRAARAQGVPVLERDARATSTSRSRPTESRSTDGAAQPCGCSPGTSSTGARCPLAARADRGVRGRPACVELGRGAPSGGAALVAAHAGGGEPRRAADRADLPQPGAAAPACARSSRPGADEVERRRRQRAARAGADLRAPQRCGCVPGRSVASRSSRGWIAGSRWSRTSTAAHACRSPSRSSSASARSRAPSPARRRRLVLGGDLNLRAPQVTGMEHVAARDVDHLFAAGLRLLESEVLDRCATVGGVRVELSDHPPLLAALDG